MEREIEKQIQPELDKAIDRDKLASVKDLDYAESFGEYVGERIASDIYIVSEGYEAGVRVLVSGTNQKGLNGDFFVDYEDIGKFMETLAEDISHLDYDTLEYQEGYIPVAMREELSMEERNDVKVIYAPDYGSALEVGPVAATVEAEYGEKVVEGVIITMAHHGERADNPAPCNWPDVPVLSEGTILVSHLDLDTVGGIMALKGTKPERDEFWQAAEYIDVSGPHHIHELPENIQDELNAVYAYADTLDRLPRETMEVSEIVDEYMEKVGIVLDERHPEHDQMIADGKEWAAVQQKETERCLVQENEFVRVFDSDGPFTAASYYSPEHDQVTSATVTLNRFGAITIAFENAEELGLNAAEIAQELWGPEAGGRAGIAGSPRGEELSRDELMKAAEIVEDRVKEAVIARETEKIIVEELESRGLDPQTIDIKALNLDEYSPEEISDALDELEKSLSKDEQIR